MINVILCIGQMKRIMIYETVKADTFVTDSWNYNTTKVAVVIYSLLPFRLLYSIRDNSTACIAYAEYVTSDLAPKN